MRWLRGDLAAYARLAGRGDPKLRQAARLRLTRWLKDADFASVRGEEALRRLPEHERQEWGRLWAEAAGLLRKVDGK